MSTYLAFKYSRPNGILPSVFHTVTRARLVTNYPHGGIVKDGKLMHSNLSNGLHDEPFNSEGWDLFSIPEQPWQDGLYEKYKGAKYDVFSQLAFLLPWRVRDSSRFYCYEWQYLWLTGKLPTGRVVPETLLKIAFSK